MRKQDGVRARSLDIGLLLAIRFDGTVLVINIHELRIGCLLRPKPRTEVMIRLSRRCRRIEFNGLAEPRSYLLINAYYGIGIWNSFSLILTIRKPQTCEAIFWKWGITPRKSAQHLFTALSLCSSAIIQRSLYMYKYIYNT